MRPYELKLLHTQPLIAVEYKTSKEEVMNGLHDLVVLGKVLYLLSHPLPTDHTSRI